VPRFFLDDDFSVSIFALVPFQTRANLQMVCKRFYSLVKNKHFCNFRKKIGIQEWTLIAHQSSSGQHYIFNPSNELWQKCSQCPITPREWDSAGPYLLVSGTDAQGFPSVSTYDAETNLWKQWPLPEKYLQHHISCCLDNNNCYAISYAIHSDPNLGSCSVLILDRTKNIKSPWRTLAITKESKFVEQAFRACVVRKSKLIVAGKNRLASFDIKSCTWSFLPGIIPVDASFDYCATSAVELDDCILGFRMRLIDDFVAFSKLFLYNLQAQRFESTPPLPDDTPDVGYLVPMQNHILLIPFPQFQIDNAFSWQLDVNARKWTSTKIPPIRPSLSSQAHSRLYFDCIMPLCI